MRKILRLLPLLLLAATAATAQTPPDTRCLSLMGVPLEGPVDSVVAGLKRQGCTEWGTSDDSTEFHFRGNFYGIRSKIMVSADPQTRFATSAYITIGPYGTDKLFERNFQYYYYKLGQDYGQFTRRNGAYYIVGDYGLVKLSDQQNDNKTRDITVFLLTTAPFYKDAANFGLRGNVMEVITENPVMENPVEHFDRQGRSTQTDLTDRRYSPYGYLQQAAMTEPSGRNSQLSYAYDASHRLARRTLDNAEAGIRSVNEYTYTDDGDIATQSQKVFDATNDCILSVNLKYTYNDDDYDDNGNWTSCTVELTYWEKDAPTRQSTITQTRRISYWDEE